MLAALFLGTGATSRAASASRVFGTSLFLVGVGLKLGGTVVQNDARGIYDDYLLTAVQDEIATLREDYRRKKRLGDGLSNVGNGLLVVGALFGVVSVLRQPAEKAAETSETAYAPRLLLAPSLARREVVFAWRRYF